MYNLFVSGYSGSWNGNPWTVDRSRCVRSTEYTDADIAERFGDLDASQVRELMTLPCIFAYEAWEKAPRFGFIREVVTQRSQAKVKIKYDLVECERFLTADEFSELEMELDVRGPERRRTHWAVKDVDLHRVLLDAKGIALPRRGDVVLGPDPPAASAVDDELWTPASAPRLFMSHLATCKKDVRALSSMLQQFGFACFVAHDAIEPSRKWRREIERALNSCDVLVAYVTPGFSSSAWTDQEIGWALGRGLPVIPISVAGEMPAGFLGSYQAVVRTRGVSEAELSRKVFRAICDAVFNEQRPGSHVVGGKTIPLVTNALRRASTPKTASQFHDVLLKIPRRLWTPERRSSLKQALGENRGLLSRTPSRDRTVPVIEVLQRVADGVVRGGNGRSPSGGTMG